MVMIMIALLVLVAPLLATVPFVAADVIPEGSAAHFFSSQSTVHFRLLSRP